MAAKTANVLARIEPEVKERAEDIMLQLGVSASTVINMLYKQIIFTKSIPFSISIPKVPIALDELEPLEFDELMAQGLAEAKADASRLSADVFADLKQRISHGR